ncbi:MAG: KpsF/GutQ family sugar-phosphate isomerase [Deltaproteobacteria bacterium HGW-Deltaproteobacteria-19]|jgi:arabinose-5-phosphate isomerase|nr:MAG: KpsF/GutQ family sugar-phosphate isomerase [Deltaproteobacteria bacterium HGW-Deltaproteobacteria-19]
MATDQTIAQAKEVLKIEAESILSLMNRLDRNFSRAVNLIWKSKGRVIVTGIGKSGLIGKKIVATLTSTGTHALFLHPVEGLHGDLGIVTKDDVLLAISNSGETQELLMIIGSVQAIGTPLIVFTGNPASSLARVSEVVIDVGVEREACPFGLTPTSSTTAALAMGDALAVALIGKRKFREQDFYKLHPGGTLGLRLREKVRDVMISGERIPRVFKGTPVLQAIEVLDEKNMGFVLVTNKKDRLLGILTDGDVRRHIRKGRTLQGPIDGFMTPNPRTIGEDTTLGETIEAMQQREITTLVVVNGKNRLMGYVHLHDILGRGGTLKMTVIP